MRISEKRAVLFALVVLAAPFALAGQAPSLSKAQGIEQVVSHYERYGYFNGTLLVAEHGKVIYAKGVGEANMESHTPNTPHTRFGIASITKQFTALLVLQQVAEGKILLGGKVSGILEEMQLRVQRGEGFDPGAPFVSPACKSRMHSLVRSFVSH